MIKKKGFRTVCRGCNDGMMLGLRSKSEREPTLKIGKHHKNVVVHSILSPAPTSNIYRQTRHGGQNKVAG